MTHCRLLRITVERFKSFEAKTVIDLKPLTVILGRNNCGKSSIIQSLLLLKQTLAEPRPEVPLHLDGTVAAFNLRELTWGWPEQGEKVEGPSFGLRWKCDVNVNGVFKKAVQSEIANLIEKTELRKLRDFVELNSTQSLKTEIQFKSCDMAGMTVLTEIILSSPWMHSKPLFRRTNTNGKWQCYWRENLADKIEVELDHFLPYLQLDRRNVGPRSIQRAWHNAYSLLFAQPLEALKRMLAEFQYLGSTRSLPPSLYKSSNVSPQEIGASGEQAAQLLHRRQRDVVHYLPPLEVNKTSATIPEYVRERPLVDAVNEVLTALSIHDPLSVHEIQDVGFRLLFGQASLLHVGRGLTYILPLVELGLFTDPLRFESLGGDISRSEYESECSKFTHFAVEEPEAHLHPKVQSLLTHWMVSLAMSNRRLIIETHSDHLVRRLRGLAARAGAGSELENWLLENVVILEVEQNNDGVSTVKSSRLTAEGGIAERWPADFMDEAGEEDSAIYYAGMAKEAPRNRAADPTEIIHDDGAEPEVE